MTRGQPPVADRGPARVAAALGRIEDWLLVAILSVMIVLGGLQIGLRNVAGTSIAWGDPLLRVLVLWVGLLGAMAATRDRNHIRIDVLSRFLSGPLARIAHVLTGLASSVVCAVLAWQGARFVQFDLEAGTTAFAGVPVWLCELILPLGFGVMALRFAADCFAPPPASERVRPHP